MLIWRLDRPHCQLSANANYVQLCNLSYESIHSSEINLDFVILAYGNTADTVFLTKLLRKRSTHNFPAYVRRSVEVTLAILAPRTADCLVELHRSADKHKITDIILRVVYTSVLYCNLRQECKYIDYNYP